MTRLILSALGFSIGLTLWTPPASAQPVGAWCMTKGNDKTNSFIDCQWATFERCRQEALINRGSCSPNPDYRGPPARKKRVN